VLDNILILIITFFADLKIGMSESSVFDVYHPQAKELYSVTSDLKKVCEKLQDPFARIGKSVSGAPSNIRLQ
jgi:DNA ligase-4